VHHPRRVRGRQADAHLVGDAEHASDGKQPHAPCLALARHLGQGNPVRQLHDQVQLVADAARVERGHHVRVPQPGDQLGLPAEPADRLCQLALEAQIYHKCVRYYPFVLGAQPVRPVDLAAFYAAIANEGMRPSPYVIESIERSGRKLISGTALFTPSGELLAKSHQVWIGRAPIAEAA